MQKTKIHPSVQRCMPQVAELLKRHRIERAYLFGSVLTDSFNENSDVDFLVDIQPDLDPVEAGGHLWDLTYALEDLLQRHVDLITQRSLRNPVLIEELNATKFPVYG